MSPRSTVVLVLLALFVALATASDAPDTGVDAGNRRMLKLKIEGETKYWAGGADPIATVKFGNVKPKKEEEEEEEDEEEDDTMADDTIDDEDDATDEADEDADVETDDLDLAEDLDEEEEQEDSAPTAGIQISGTTSTNRDGARGDRGTRTGGTNGK